MSMQTAKNNVLSLQRMKAANAGDTGNGSYASFFCKKNSTISVFTCVING
ncbi:class III lanthipeptide [Bacillus thuringiensis]|mgnify:CR=1 FL=1|nr:MULTISPECIES: class III lanthipeptide [Bacillus cereus group]AZV64862.1 SapB/AmfS family lantipeptide [Bacillus cereus]MCU5455876.1 class III lanthipeptide [Bacillus cereus]MCU5512831.1 class III lanthipeptide [Bacillus cereus]MCU5550266.1 class III lanthipeptide [Bacillus cereus]MCU5621699.1 class III lanthipeptide [Bacillus cereus]